MSKANAVRTFNGVMEYQLWAGGEGAKAEILHVTDRGGQLVVTYRAEEAPRMVVAERLAQDGTPVPPGPSLASR